MPERALGTPKGAAEARRAAARARGVDGGHEEAGAGCPLWCMGRKESR
jgi:hypothetical protein